jgi:catechol 2,3-dioxygenase-like lactoylglutathione lyase family enzyme
MRLNQVTVPTTDLERGIRFYSGLGLQLIVRDDDEGYARFLCPDGDATFSLHAANWTGHPARLGGIVVYFECDDLDDRCARLAAAGYRFTSMPVDQPWLWREASLEDPDGVQIRLFHAGVNRKDPPWRLP